MLKPVSGGSNPAVKSPAFRGLNEGEFTRLLSLDPEKNRQLRIQHHQEKIQYLLVRYNRNEPLANQGSAINAQYLKGITEELLEHARQLGKNMPPEDFRAYLESTVENRCLKDLPALKPLYEELPPPEDPNTAKDTPPTEATVPAWRAYYVNLRNRLRRKPD